MGRRGARRWSPRRLRQHSHGLQPADAGAEHPGGEQEQEDRGHREEPLQADAPTSPKDRPAERGRRREAEERAQRTRPARRRGRLGEESPEEEYGLGTLAKHAGERDQADDPESV